MLALALALATGRWQPAAFGLMVGGVTLATASRFSLPPQVATVYLPIVATGVGAVLLFRKQDWATASDPDGSYASPSQTVLIVFSGVVGLILGVMSGIGKPLLRSLGWDVIGIIPSEQTEIAVGGGCVGAFGGIIVGVIVVSSLWPARPQTPGNEAKKRDT